MTRYFLINNLLFFLVTKFQARSDKKNNLFTFFQRVACTYILSLAKNSKHSNQNQFNKVLCILQSISCKITLYRGVLIMLVSNKNTIIKPNVQKSKKSLVQHDSSGLSTNNVVSLEQKLSLSRISLHVASFDTLAKNLSQKLVFRKTNLMFHFSSEIVLVMKYSV